MDNLLLVDDEGALHRTVDDVDGAVGFRIKGGIYTFVVGLTARMRPSFSSTTALATGAVPGFTRVTPT